MEIEKIYNDLIHGIRDFFKKHNFQHAVLGVSGGIDSAVTLKLAVDALEAKNVTALIMPELNVTREENIYHSKGLCEYFGVKVYYQPINSFLIDYGLTSWTQNLKAAMNTKARIRMTLLYNYANSTNAIVLGTSNKSEILLGYGTKHGDLAADLEVIGSLFKKEVYQLANFLGMPKELIEKAPSAELLDGQTDEEELGGSYPEIDPILISYSQGKMADQIIAEGHKPHLVRATFQRIKDNAHKNKLAYVLPINIAHNTEDLKPIEKIADTKKEKEQVAKEEKKEENMPANFDNETPTLF